MFTHSSMTNYIPVAMSTHSFIIICIHPKLHPRSLHSSTFIPYYTPIAMFTHPSMTIQFHHLALHLTLVSTKCKAKVRLVKVGDGGSTKWIISTPDNEIEHLCEPNAGLLRAKMKDLVREDPAKAVGKAIHQIRVEAATEYGEHEELYENIIAELGNDKALETNAI